MAASRSLASLLVLAAVCFAAAAGTQEPAQPTKLFIDWMTKQAPKASIASVDSGVELADVCLREVNVEGCSCYYRRGSCCTSYNVEAEMACCSKGEDRSHKGLDKLTEEIVSTGKCSYTQSYLEEEVKINEYDDSVVKVGTFTGSCNLNKESTTCGDPACDGLTIAIQGDILKANNVAFEGRPLNAKKSDKCEKIFRAEECAVPDTGKVQIAGANIGPFTADNPTASIVGRQSNSYRKEEERRERQQRERYEAERREREIEEERRVLEKYEEEQKKYAHEDKKKFYSGKGLVFMGTFYSVNRLHDTKQASGIYQAVQVLEVESTGSETCPEGAYVARPNEVYFRFVKSPSPYPSSS